MGWIWREKPDGSRAFAYPVYLGGAIAALGLIAAIHSRLSLPAAVASTGRASGSGRGAEVGSITGAAALASPVPDSVRRLEPAERSYRLAKKTGAPVSAAAAATPESFDAIDATLRPAAAEAGVEPGKRLPAFSPLPPAFEGEAAPHSTLLGYRDPSADSGVTPPRVAAVATVVLPRGALIPVYLLTTVDTSNPAAVLQFGLADDVIQHGRCRLRLGTHLLGKLAGRPMRGRLELTAEAVLFPDGTQRPIAATAVEADDLGAQIRPGVAAEFIPQPGWAQTVPYVSELATGFLGILQSRAQERFAVGASGLTLQTSVPNEMQGSASQAGSQAITDYTRARLKEIEDRYAAYYLIPAGTACWMQLDSNFTLPMP